MNSKVQRVCPHCGHDPDAKEVIRSVVVDQPGRPVMAPCVLSGCQYGDVDRLREQLHHEGLEHTECQEALVTAQARLQAVGYIAGGEPTTTHITWDGEGRRMVNGQLAPEHRSRQFLHLERKTLARLVDAIPNGCPIAVYKNPAGRGFVVGPAFHAPAGSAYLIGRFQVVSAFIDGFVRAWRMLP